MLATILLCIFITLKLVGTIAWDWIWVLAPAWIPLCIWLFVFIIAAIGGVVSDTFAHKKRNW